MEAWDRCIVFLMVFLFGSIRGEGNIRKPPSITKHPRANIIYRSDDAVTLECQAEGIPAVSYEWKKNGFEVNQNLVNIHKGADGTITIQPATSMDEGFYQCLAKNQYGTALSITSHIQRAILDSASGTPTTLQKSVQEGMPFRIEADPRKSFPNPTYGWESATDTVDKSPITLRPSKRIQIAENGDLHFAYALPEDDLEGRIYKCTTYNPHLDVQAGGSYTQLSVTRSISGVRQFVPTLGFSSDTQTVAIVGGSVTLRCFFYGNPEPTISWSGPRNTLPIRRYTLYKFNTELTINNVTATDEGDYVCTASNTQGRNTHTLQIRVEAVLRFLTVENAPRDVNVTEGDSFTFNCKADVEPEATIVWLQDGMKLDPNNPPKRFVFSSDRKSLTIRDVCRDCVDRESKTDLMVIQCNASNVHGYAFASGYLNVLSKTRVTLYGNTNVSVNAHEEREVQFNCNVSSDSSTLPSIRWFKVEQFGDQLVRDDPPHIGITEGTLTIRVAPDNTHKGDKYSGDYKCVGDNGYSSDFKTARLAVISPTTQAQDTTAPSRGISAPDTTTLTKDTNLVSDTTETQTTTASPGLTPGGLMIPDFWIWVIIATAILVLLLLVFSVCTTIIQCTQKTRNNDTVNKEQSEGDFQTEPLEPDYETIDDDFMKSAQTIHPSLSSDSLPNSPQLDVHPRSDADVIVGGIGGLGPGAAKPVRQIVRNKSTAMERRRQELNYIPEANESSAQTGEYMALAEREPAIPTVYAVLEQKEELSRVRYASFKSPERVKRIKSWFF